MPSHSWVCDIIESKQTIELLAAIEHQRWAHWQRYLHDQCERQEDGSLIVPAELVTRWESQIETPYAKLSEQEQESDREQVHKYLAAIVEVLTQPAHKPPVHP